jgi:hypothetical protein
MMMGMMSMTADKEKRICPFSMNYKGGYGIPCLEEKCMAWQYEYTDLVKPNWEKQVVRHGYCKLI